MGVDLQYPLYGSDGSNYVQYVGAARAQAGFGSISTCAGWRDAVDRGHYAWVVVTPFGFPIGTAANVSPELRWMAGTAAVPVLREATSKGELAVLFRIAGTLDPRACRG